MLLDILKHLFYGLIVFVPLEYLLPRFREKKIFRSKWKIDILYSIVGGIMNMIGTLFIILVGYTLLGPLIPPQLKELVSSQHFIVQAIEVMIIADIGYYFVHRLFHQVPFLWKFHAIHHSIEEMDWLAAHRVHPVDQSLTRGISLIIPSILGFSPISFTIFGFIFGWHSLLKHSNVNVGFGPLRWIMASPIYHHWHHADQEEAIDKNFAGQFPLIDILMGTAIMSEPPSPEAYGTKTKVPDNFVDQIFAPFRREPGTNSASEQLQES